MTVPLLSFTESQAYTALRSFLLGTLPTGVEVIKGQVNRVAEPRGEDFVVFWPLSQNRLGTNEVTYTDTEITASIAGTVLSVTAVAAGALQVGVLLLGTGVGPAVNTALGAQLSGSLGGTGTYAVTPSQTLASQQLFAGMRNDLAPIDLVVQLDVHGPTSGDNAVRIATLFRSEYGTSAFGAVAVTPLYCDDPRQAPFINNEQMFEYRWTIDAHLQLNSVVGTPQQFADQLNVNTLEDLADFPPSFVLGISSLGGPDPLA